MNSTRQKLEINSDELAEKCTQFSKFYFGELLKNKGFADVSDFVEELFTKKELMFLSILWLKEKSGELVKEAAQEEKEKMPK